MVDSVYILIRYWHFIWCQSYLFI